MKKVIDYNPPGKFSLQAVTTRYDEYCKRFHVARPLDLSPSTSEDANTRWVYPVMYEIAQGVREGDRACMEIAVEHVEFGKPVTFGVSLRSTLARELRRQSLDAYLAERLRRHFVKMLTNGQCGREFKDYRRLFVKLGPGEHGHDVLQLLESENPYVRKHAEYLASKFCLRSSP